MVGQQTEQQQYAGGNENEDLRLAAAKDYDFFNFKNWGMLNEDF
jgi:hypothetical protein